MNAAVASCQICFLKIMLSLNLRLRPMVQRGPEKKSCFIARRGEKGKERKKEKQRRSSDKTLIAE